MSADGSETTSTLALQELVAGYRLVRKLGQGGMGEVWVGEHQRLDRHAAVKLLLSSCSSDEGVLERFFIEARATSRIRHQGIVEVNDCGVTPSGRAYIVMELLQGQNLREFIAVNGRTTLSLIASVGAQVASAVGAAHAQNIVHRDLKPDNIFLVQGADSSSEVPRAKVLDFGIAKLMGAQGDARLTGTGILVGTPAYMSPEQSRGRGQIDHRTDIYSLGCILYEFAAGRPPFTHEGIGELIAARLTEDPPPLQAVAPGVPDAFASLVDAMLARDPDQRISTMAQVETSLKSILAAGGAFTSSPALVPVGRTAILTPAPNAGVGATRHITPAPQRPQEQTTFSRAAAEVPPQPTSNRIGLVISVAAAALVVSAVFFLWPKQSPPQPHEGALVPATAAPLPEAALAAPVALAPAPAPVPVDASPSMIEPSPRGLTPATERRPRRTDGAQVGDLDSLSDPANEKKPPRRPRGAQPKPGSAAPDLDSLAE